MDKQKKSPDSGKKTPVKAKSKSPPEYSNDLVSQHEVQYLTRYTRFRLSTEYELSICNCKHIMRMTIGERHSVVNPQKWLCNICGTTDSVWACLSCPNVACGRFIHEHALNHYLDSVHPLVIDVNELYVYCYECEEYVLNDNKSGDLKVLRETLQAIRYQNFTGTTRSGHTLRTAAITADEDVQMRRRLQQQQLDRDDRNITAIWHSRFVRQRKIFRRWLMYVRNKKDFIKENDSDSGSNLKEFVDERCPAPPTSSLDQSNELIIHSTSSQEVPEDIISKLTSPQANSPTQSLDRLSIKTDVSKTSETPKTPGPILSPVSEISSSSNTDLPSLIPGVTVAKPIKDTASDLHKKCSPLPNVKKHASGIAGIKPTEIVDLTKVLNAGTYKNKVLLLKSDNSSTSHRTIPAQAFKNLYLPSSENAQVKPTKSGSEAVLADETSSKTASTDPSDTTENKSFKLENKSCTSSVVQAIDLPSSSSDVEDNSKGRADTSNSSIVDPLDTESQSLTASLEGQRRSKRVNAASRYKEIMNRLTLSTNEPLQKKMRLSDVAHLVDDPKHLVHPPRRSLRLSLRSMKLNKAKAAKEARLKKKLNRTKAASNQIFKRERKRSKMERTLPSRTMPNRKTRTHSISKSLYDSIPNRAVTSLIPGVTGLRNLGNTCYLNSIIQVLGHLQKFRRCLLAVRDLEIDDGFPLPSETKTAAAKLRSWGRRSTIEMYESQTSRSISKRLLRMQAGLNGGREIRSPDKGKVESPISTKPRLLSNTSQPNSLSLCHELHDLYHIMWSGKWKLVSPYHFLSSVWQLIPSFRGYSQQDAQEFLCELLDKIVSELERRRRSQVSQAERLAARISGVVHAVFEGRLHSQVRCQECKHVSSTFEPFWDLSLEFPQRYHSATSSSWKNSNQGCSLTEMLDKFTEAEKLDGGRVYSCSYCNGLYFPQVKDGTRRRRLSNRKPPQKLSEAEKQIKIIELPQILRFHLKRFRWSGRNNREKIIVPVHFPPELDMKPHCWIEANNYEGGTMYDLSAVVIHHGRGFGSGHYTAYCWNDIGKFWVHCNDSNLELCSIDDVMAAQAYILFYSQRGLDPHPHVFTPPSTPDLSPPITPTPLISDDLTSDQVFDEPGKG